MMTGEICMPCRLMRKVVSVCRYVPLLMEKLPYVLSVAPRQQGPAEIRSTKHINHCRVSKELINIISARANV